MTLKELIDDLRLNHEHCPKEIILLAADTLEKLSHEQMKSIHTRMQ